MSPHLGITYHPNVRRGTHGRITSHARVSSQQPHQAARRTSQRSIPSGLQVKGKGRVSMPALLTVRAASLGYLVESCASSSERKLAHAFPPQAAGGGDSERPRRKAFARRHLRHAGSGSRKADPNPCPALPDPPARFAGTLNIHANRPYFEQAATNSLTVVNHNN